MSLAGASISDRDNMVKKGYTGIKQEKEGHAATKICPNPKGAGRALKGEEKRVLERAFTIC